MRIAATLLTLLTAIVTTAAQTVSHDVEFPGADGLTLKGTLLLPDPTGPHAAVLLLPGSGPTDRNGNQPPMLMTDLLKQIAESLAEAGVATLRFDKRATRTYAGEWPRELDAIDAFFAWTKFVGDASGALAHLRGRPEIDPARVAIAGHSEGGMIALQVAHDLTDTDHAPKGLILLATAGRKIDVVLREQVEANLEHNIPDEQQRAEFMAKLEACITAVLRREPLPDDLPIGLRPLFNPTVRSLLYSYFTIDPADLAAKVRGPVLIVQGEADAQVSSDRDTPRLETALTARASGDLHTVIIPGASHNFKDTMNNPLGFTGPVVPQAIEAITTWVRMHLAPPQRAEP